MPALAQPPAGSHVFATRSDIPIDEDPLRVLARRFDTGGVVGYVIVGASIDEVNEAVRSLIAALAVTIPVAVAVLGGMVWWLVGRTLRPVEHIRREVAAISLGELDRRVPSPGTHDEIDELATTMNAMLARLETSAGRQRRFVSDASHELRTPLARMRSTLEVELSTAPEQQTDGSLEAACRSALDEVVGMQDLVDDLLLIARHDTAASRRDFELVDLDVVVDDEVRILRTVATVPIDMTGVAGATVLGNAPQLARVVRNLLTNAVRHAEREVKVALREFDLEDHDLADSDVGADAAVQLIVDDDGPGIPTGERER